MPRAKREPRKLEEFSRAELNRLLRLVRPWNCHVFDGETARHCMKPAIGIGRYLPGEPARDLCEEHIDGLGVRLFAVPSPTPEDDKT